MAGIVAYASSEDEDSDREEEQEQQQQQADLQQSLLPISKAGGETGHDAKTEAGATAPGASQSAAILAGKEELRAEVPGDDANTEQKKQKIKKDKKKHKKSKGKGRKHKSLEPPEGGLPLIEAPVDLNKNSDDDDGFSDEEDYDDDIHKNPTLGKLSSLWDEEDASANVMAQDSQFSASSSGLNSSAHGPQAPSFDADAQYGAALAFSQGFEDEDTGDDSVTTARASDRKIRQLLSEGRSLDAAEVNVTSLSADNVKAHAKAVREKADADRSLDPVRTTAVAGASIDARHVTGTMKRKHQLMSIALDAQQNEGDLQKMWAREKQARANAGKKYGF